jgi:hypothetical protein
MTTRPAIPAMKNTTEKDWPFTILMTALLILTILCALFDPSCQRRYVSVQETWSSRR